MQGINSASFLSVASGSIFGVSRGMSQPLGQASIFNHPFTSRPKLIRPTVAPYAAKIYIDTPRAKAKTYAAQTHAAKPMRISNNNLESVPVQKEDLRIILDYVVEPHPEYPEDHRNFVIKTLNELIKSEDTGDATDSEPIHPALIDPRNVLAPLNSVFLDDAVIDDVLISLGLPELLDGAKCDNSGCILNGPPGTGKTVLMRAVAKIYENLGCYSHEVNLANISEGTVNSLARNLDLEIDRALLEARKRGRPSIIYLDEATLLVKKIVPNSSVQNYYQAALDVLKKYIGNYPELIFAISTNGDRDSFDKPLIRDGRLNVHTIEYPSQLQKVRMWEHFLREYDVIDDLQPEQYQALAKAFPANSQGAAIVKFAQNILKSIALSIIRKEGFANIREALINGVSFNVVKHQVRETITFEDLLHYAQKAVVASVVDDKKDMVIHGFVSNDHPSRNIKS